MKSFSRQLSGDYEEHENDEKAENGGKTILGGFAKGFVERESNPENRALKNP